MTEKRLFKLRSMLDRSHADLGAHIEESPTIEGSDTLRDWLIVRVPNDVPSEHVRRFSSQLRERFGPKVLVVCGDVEFCVFEEVAPT